MQVNFSNVQSQPFNVTGYFRSYIDNGFHEIWQIQVPSPFPLPEDQLIDTCKNFFLGMDSSLPDSEEYHKEIQQGGNHYHDWCYYQRGFYKFYVKQNGIYEFEYIAPDQRPEAWQSDENRNQT